MTKFNAKTYITKYALDQIKEHMKFDNSKGEIYGWLIGFCENQDVYVIASMPCFDYEVQTIISARPAKNQLDILASSLPLGVSVIGIYHTHLGKVFLSNIDNRTLLSYITINPNFVSLVTNKKNDLEIFRLTNVDSNEITAIKYKIMSMPKLNNIKFCLKLKGLAKVNADQPILSLSNLLRNYVDEIFKNEQVKTNMGNMTENSNASIIKSDEIIINTPRFLKLNDDSTKKLMKLKFSFDLIKDCSYVEEMIFSNTNISSLKVMIIDLLMQKIYLGQISNNVLIPAKEKIIDFLNFRLNVIYNMENTILSFSFIKSLIIQSKFMLNLGENEFAEKILLSCKDYLIDIADKKEILIVDNLLSKILRLKSSEYIKLVARLYPRGPFSL